MVAYCNYFAAAAAVETEDMPSMLFVNFKQPEKEFKLKYRHVFKF